MKFNLVLWLTLSTLSLMFGCSSKVEDINEKSENSMFKISDVKVQGSQVYSQNKNWPDFKNKMVISMSACLQDSVYTERIIGGQFRIKSNAVNMVDTTEVSGCIYWNEVVDFNYLGKEDYLVVSGKIIGEGKFKGSQNYDIVINPWKNESMAMRNQSNLKFFELNKATDVYNTFHTNLFLDDVEFKVNKKKFSMSGTELEVGVKMSPQFKRLGADGMLIKNFFTKGQFNAHYYLIERDLHSGKRSILATVYKGNIKLESGMLSDTIKLNVKDHIASNTAIELGVELSGNDAPQELGVLRGVVQLDSISGVRKASFNELSSLNFNAISMKAYSYKNTTFDGHGVIIDDITFTRGSTTNRQGKKKVTVNTTVCLVDPILRERVQEHEFRVKLTSLSDNEEVIFDSERTTDYRGGCFSINPKIEYSELNTRKWKKYSLEVSSADSPFIDIYKARTVYINPWIENNDFGIDSKDLDGGELPQIQDPKAPRLYIESLSYKKIDPVKKSFEIKNNLSFNFDLAYTFKVTPKIINQQNYVNDQSFQEVPNGKYRLRGVVLVPNEEIDYADDKANLDQFFPLTGFDTEVEVVNGKIEKQINLPINVNGLMFITSRSAILLEMSAISDEFDVQPAYSFRFFRGRPEQTDSEKINALDAIRIQQTVNLKSKITSYLDKNKEMLEIDYDLSDYNHESFVKKLNDLDEVVVSGQYVKADDKWKVESQKLHTYLINTPHNYMRYKKIDIDKSRLEAIIQSPQRISAKDYHELCKLYFEPATKQDRRNGRTFVMLENNPEFAKCKTSPQDYIGLRKYEHIIDINKKPDLVMFKPSKIHFSKASFTSKGQNYAIREGQRDSNYTYSQVEAFASVGVEIPIVKKLGIEFMGGVRGSSGQGKRTDVYVTTESNELYSYLNRQIIQTGINFVGEGFRMMFKARVKSCMLVYGKEFEVENTYSNNYLVRRGKADKKKYKIRPSKRYYFCLEKPVEVDATEDWHVLAMETEGLVSSNEQQSGQAVSVIKGKENFEKFSSKEFRNNIEILLFENNPLDNDTYFQKYMKSVRSEINPDSDFSYGQLYPGLLAQ